MWVHPFWLPGLLHAWATLQRRRVRLLDTARRAAMGWAREAPGEEEGSWSWPAPKDGWRRGAEEAKRQPSREIARGVSFNVSTTKGARCGSRRSKATFFFFSAPFYRASDDANSRSAPGRRQGIIRVRGAAERGHGMENWRCR